MNVPALGTFLRGLIRGDLDTQFTGLDGLVLGERHRFAPGGGEYFLVETGRIPLMAWLLFAANIAWTVAYDTAYAMADRDDDLKIGVKSSAILFGRWDRLMVALNHAIALGLLYAVGVMAHLGPVYDGGLGLALGFALYEQGLLRERRPLDCFRAFLNNNWFGGSVFPSEARAQPGSARCSSCRGFQMRLGEIEAAVRPSGSASLPSHLSLAGKP
ncbi:MAG: UbiA family prenyltransferase [Acidiferrobacter sp.]